MRNKSPEETRKSSVEALKMVYYVIIGLAIIEGLSRTFVKGGEFLGFRIFSGDNLGTTLLLAALAPTICRFVHGASVHLDIFSEKKFKPLFDFVGFFVQASLFYLMANTLDYPISFLFLFIIMLASDAIWIFVLASISYISWDKTSRQWFVSDFCIIALLLLIYLVDRDISHYLSLIAVALISLTATVIDYRHNRDFYFPIANCAD